MERSLHIIGKDFNSTKNFSPSKRSSIFVVINEAVFLMTRKIPTVDFALFLKIGVTILAASYTILFFFLSIPRLLFPYEIEFFEGTVLEHALRIFQGKPVFTSPSISFVDLQYQPFYYYVTAGAMHIFGVNYFSGRIVSFSSAIICATIIFYIIHKETRSWLYSFVGVSLFFAAYGVTGYWYELARVDTLMLLFLIASIVSLLLWKNKFMIILSAFFLVLGFFTKQELIFYFAPAFIWLFLLNKRSAIIFAASSLIFLAAGFFLFTLDSGRWYFYFTFTLPGALGAEQHWDRMWVLPAICFLPMLPARFSLRTFGYPNGKHGKNG
jgi:4-amino-4-deoxy-L-arabinose transferase-like glycosyltransferase